MKLYPIKRVVQLYRVDDGWKMYDQLFDVVERPYLR